jgi:hypothetical protein
MVTMATRVDPTEIPEVQDYLEAKAMLDAYIHHNQAIFEQYRELAENVNRAREGADKIVRSKEVSCGPWDIYQTQTTYDANVLYEALGREAFIRVGGKVQMQAVYEVDKAKIEAAVARGDIPSELVPVIKKVSPRYKAPKDIVP